MVGYFGDYWKTPGTLLFQFYNQVLSAITENWWCKRPDKINIFECYSGIWGQRLWEYMRRDHGISCFSMGYGLQHILKEGNLPMKFKRVLTPRSENMSILIYML